MSNYFSVPYRYEKKRVIPQALVARLARGRLLLGIALLMIAIALILTFLAPVFWAEKRYREEKGKIHSGFGELLWLERQGVISPADWQFSLIIPEIDLNARVVAEVDAGDEAAYKEALTRGLAHAKGSSLPNQEGLVYIFGHSTNLVWNVNDYNALFYLLGKLEEGDGVDIVYQGRHYVYQVVEKEVVSASDLVKIKQTNQPKLILSTCWPPGTTWHRLIVTALPEERSAERATFNQIL